MAEWNVSNDFSFFLSLSFYLLITLFYVYALRVWVKQNKKQTQTGCVRLVHYTADAMGFHPTVTYEGDCQQQQQQTAGSINPATSFSDSTLPSASLKDVSTAPINPSAAATAAAAFLSRPVLSAVPGLINPLTTTTTDVQDSARETFIIPRPSQQQQDSSTPVGLQVGSASPSAPVTTDAAAAATSLSQKIPADIDRLWQSLGPAAGVVPTTTSNNGNSAAAPAAVKSPAGQQQQSEEIVVESLLPEGLSTPTRLMPVRLSLGNTQTLVDVAHVETTKQQSIINEVPETVPPSVITGKVQSSDAVPDSILSLLETFEPTKRTNQNDDDQVADPLEAQPSGFSERILKDESLDSSVDLSAVESAPEESVQVEETIESKSFVESDEPSAPVQADETAKSTEEEETIESKSIPQSDEIAHEEEEEEYSFKSVVEEETIQPKNADAPTESDEKERSLSTLTQSALGNVKNFTAPLTQLISSSVQNLTNPVTALLFNTFNKNKLTTTVAPSTVYSVVTEEPTTTQSIPPAGKVETDDQGEDIPSGKLIKVTDAQQNQEEEAFPGTDDGALPADIPPVSQHTKQTILDTRAAEEEAEPILSEGDLINPVQIQQNFESISSLQVNDPAAATAVVVEPVGPSVVVVADDMPQDSVEPTPIIQVSDGIPVDAPADVGETIVSVADPVPAAAEGESSKVAGLEETPVQQQVGADVLRETSSWNVPVEVEESKEVEPTQGNAELVYQQVNADEGSSSSTLPETYASMIVAEPVPVIYSHQVATGPFFVRQPAAVVSPHTVYPMSVRQGTARSIDSVAATPYGLRVHKFVPTYGGRPTYVYNQHRRQGHYQPQQPVQHYQPTAYAAARFVVPAAAPIKKHHGQAYGMRYATVQQATPVQLHQTPFKKLHHVVRPKAPKQPTWSSPLYSTHVY